MKLEIKLMSALLCLIAACAGRTTAATQPTPADYDASKNDPKAVELADAVIAGLGGQAAWDSAKQIQWDVEVESTGKLVAKHSHAWDRWNARHRFESVHIPSYLEAQETNDPDGVVRTYGMYPLFERDRGAAFQGSNQISANDRRQFVQTAFQRWSQDSYMLAFPFKLKDPGVYLSYEGERTEDYCDGTCDAIKVTFHPEVQHDVPTYVVLVNRATKIPEALQIEMENSPAPVIYAVSDWRESGGIKLPGKLDNVGARNMGSPEVWTFSNIRVSTAPDDRLYIPAVH